MKAFELIGSWIVLIALFLVQRPSFTESQLAKRNHKPNSKGATSIGKMAAKRSAKLIWILLIPFCAGIDWVKHIRYTVSKAVPPPPRPSPFSFHSDQVSYYSLPFWGSICHSWHYYSSPIHLRTCIHCHVYYIYICTYINTCKYRNMIKYVYIYTYCISIFALKIMCIYKNTQFEDVYIYIYIYIHIWSINS